MVQRRAEARVKALAMGVEWRFAGRMTSSQVVGRWARFFDRRGLLIGVAVGVPSTVLLGSAMASVRSFFDTTNAALVLTIAVVAVAALGGRAAGVVTALAAVASFDFFHTRPYLSLAIDSREDVETSILLLVVGLLVGTIATAGQRARRREGRRAARSGASTTSPKLRHPAANRRT